MNHIAKSVLALVLVLCVCTVHARGPFPLPKKRVAPPIQPHTPVAVVVEASDPPTRVKIWNWKRVGQGPEGQLLICDYKFSYRYEDGVETCNADGETTNTRWINPRNYKIPGYAFLRYVVFPQGTDSTVFGVIATYVQQP